MTLPARNERTDQAVRETATAKALLGTHIAAGEPDGSLNVSIGTGALGGSETLSVAPGAGVVNGTKHVLDFPTDVGIAIASEGDRRDTVYMDTAGAIAVEQGRPGTLSWPDTLPQNRQTLQNAVRPAPPDMADIEGLPLATVTVIKNSGVVDASALTQLGAPAPSVSGGATLTAAPGDDIQGLLDSAESAGGGRVIAADGTHLVPDTITVPGSVTLKLANGAVLEPAGVFDLVELDKPYGETTTPAGRLIGPGTLRTRPGALEKSSITDFNGAAHIVVDGVQDFRPSRAPTQAGPRGTASLLTENVHIDAALSTTGGYGIHLKALEKFDYVWLQDFHAHVYGCEHAVRLEATGPDSASINGNRFYGSYLKPIRVVNGIIGSPADNAISHNEFHGMGQASTDMDEMYHIEGTEWQRTGTDFDLTRPATYVDFGPDTQGNAFVLDTASLLPADAVSDAGTRNVVTVTAEREFESRVYATLGGTDQQITNREVVEFVVENESGHRMDAGGEWDDSTHQYTAATRGVVGINTIITFDGGAAGDTLYAYIYHNGNRIWTHRREKPGTGQYAVETATTLSVERGDTVGIQAYAGSAMTLNAAEGQTVVTIQKLG